MTGPASQGRSSAAWSLIVLDGSYGEGGGQILRSALALSAITGRPVRVENIRARRPNPGLQAQHLSAVKAAAALCHAQVQGAALGSTALAFIPQSPPAPGAYTVDVGAARAGGSAGSVTLILQAILLPLACAPGSSRVTLQGGTHVPWSPPFHYVRDVLMPTLSRTGLHAEVHLKRWGWYPAGGGEIDLYVHGPLEGEGLYRLKPLTLTERGPLRRLWGWAAVSNLPLEIAKRMAGRANRLLREAGLPDEVEAILAESPGPGAGIFLIAEYANIRAGASAYGKKGLPAERVAEEAVSGFLAFHRSGAAVDPHLADQLILPLALSPGASRFTTSCITAHLLTSIWVACHFVGDRFEVIGEEGGPGEVRVRPVEG
jgi:RNA 3'-terminal phosphate cyclase (ATP)